MRSMVRGLVLGMAVAAVAVPGLALAQNAPEAAAAPDAAAPAQEAQVPVRAVVLFSSGVGYFEHFGQVRGNATTELRFKTEQINDILKSLVLQDLDNGRVTNITYPSQDPIDKTLRSFQVDITGSPSLASLLHQLRGAAVSGNMLNGQRFDGTILGIEQRKRPMGENETPVDVAVLNLLSGGRITSVVLDEIGTLTLEDAKLQEELNKALLALAQSRDQDKKPVVIHFDGDGERRVRLGYVVQTPVWKTSYRLILPNENEPAKLQGWAIVENQTDNDWNNIQLSLVSGRPISFIQDLYQPLYVQRPVVVPQLYASLLPQTYGAGMAAPQLEARAAQMAPAAPRAARRSEMAADQDRLMKVGDDAAQEHAFGRQMNFPSSVQSVASAADVGELFQYTVPNVTLPRQKSAMLPIVTEDIEVERLSIYNMNVLAKHPLNGARVKNTTGKHLLAGPITVLDGGSYAGDAQVENLPPGQERMVSYGIDLKMQVNPRETESHGSVMSGRIVKGVLELTYKHVRQRTYAIENKSDAPRTLIIEHPYDPAWKLVDTPEPLEKTDSLYRFRQEIPANASAAMRVSEQRVQAQTLAILPMDPGELLGHMQTGEIPQPVKDALRKAAELKRAVVETDRQIAERERKLESYPGQQSRIRENMKVVDRNSDLYRNLHQRLETQEQEIIRLQDEVEQLRRTRQEQQAALERYVADLNVG